MSNLKSMFGTSAVALLCAGAASATTIDITFNNSNGFGFLATPVYAGIHSGNFDAFNANETASDGVAQIAEIPVPPNLDGLGNIIASERLAVEPNSTGGFIADGGPIADGQSATLTIDVDDPTTNRYATFLAMFVPSNDTFFGNDNPFAYELFDAAGNLIEQTISITGASIWDAGSEVNQLLGAAAPGQDILLGEDEGGVVTSLLDSVDAAGRNGFEALEALFGISGAGSITADTVLFTIDIAESPAPVPLPAGLPLLLGGLGVMAFAKRRKKVA